MPEGGAPGAGDGGAPARNTMDLRVPSLAANAELCRVAIAVFAAALPFTIPEIEQLKVAVSEAVANCALHAYPREQPGPVALRAEIEGRAVCVEVEDWGCGIADVARAREPAFTTSPDPDHIGLGFELMEQFTDAPLEVISAPGRGTLIRMRKTPAAEGAQGPAPEGRQ